MSKQWTQTRNRRSGHVIRRIAAKNNRRLCLWAKLQPTTFVLLVSSCQFEVVPPPPETEGGLDLFQCWIEERGSCCGLKASHLPNAPSKICQCRLQMSEKVQCFMINVLKRFQLSASIGISFQHLNLFSSVRIVLSFCYRYTYQLFWTRTNIQIRSSHHHQKC